MRERRRKRTLIGIIKVHGIEANHSHFIGNDFDCIICPTLEDLEIGEWNKWAPNTEAQSLQIDLEYGTVAHDENSFVMLLGPVMLTIENHATRVYPYRFRRAYLEIEYSTYHNIGKVSKRPPPIKRFSYVC